MWQFVMGDHAHETRHEMLVRRFAVERGMLVDAGLAVMQQRGIEAVTMRAVGARVGWGPSALYRYVENRQDLLDAMVGRGLAAVRVPAPDPATWRAQLAALATDCRGALDTYPGMARLVMAQPPADVKSVAIARAVCEHLHNGGASDERANQIAELLFLFVTATSAAATAYHAEGRWGDRIDDFQQGLGVHVPMIGGRDDRFAAELKVILDGVDRVDA